MHFEQDNMTRHFKHKAFRALVLSSRLNMWQKSEAKGVSFDHTYKTAVACM